jgi:hypothetical protein
MNQGGNAPAAGMGGGFANNSQGGNNLFKTNLNSAAGFNTV